MGGKLTILGFYGAAPNVEVVLGNPGQPLMLAMVTGFSPFPGSTGDYVHAVTVTRPNGTAAFKTPESKLNVTPNGRGLLGVGFVIPPPYVWGKHSIHIYVNGEKKLDTSFMIRQASPQEVPGLGGFPFPPIISKPN